MHSMAPLRDLIFLIAFPAYQDSSKSESVCHHSIFPFKNIWIWIKLKRVQQDRMRVILQVQLTVILLCREAEQKIGSDDALGENLRLEEGFTETGHIRLLNPFTGSDLQRNAHDARDIAI